MHQQEEVCFVNTAQRSASRTEHRGWKCVQNGRPLCKDGNACDASGDGGHTVALSVIAVRGLKSKSC